MNENQVDRLISALELVGVSLANLAQIEAKRFDKEFPPEKVKREAQIHRTDDDRREQFSDQAPEEWFEETSAATAKSRFAKRFEQDTAPSVGARSAQRNRPASTEDKP